MTLRNSDKNLLTQSVLTNLVRSNNRGSNKSASIVGGSTRVSVENTVALYTTRSYIGDWGASTGANTTWWSGWAGRMVDDRQVLSETTRTQCILRRKKWSYS